mmetsp:Transcript_8588/g.22178  ORF Transcript_8588/g.22178 Transcript_8588/m.22178 type:complete len:386 (-) Transcript_8588:137-1294(-)
MAQILEREAEFPVEGSRFGIGLSWDANPSGRIDLDLQAVAFDSSGKLVDAVYFNNLKALGKGLTHSGDETTGEKGGFDEVVWADLRRLPQDVRLIAYVVSSYSGGHLRDAINGKFSVLQDNDDNVMAQFRLEESDEEVDLVAALVRSEDSNDADSVWVFRLVEEPAQDGQHFIDILEPTLGNLVRKIIPGAPRRIKAAFAMEKGSVVDLPRTSEIKSITAGLGWDTSAGQVDLDVSAVLLDDSLNVMDVAFFGNLTVDGVTHSGDNLTGEGEGDDEQISVNLEGMSDVVKQIMFVINIYTRGKSFDQVASPYCRITSSNGDELCRYMLKEAGSEQGLMIARLFREQRRWSFQAVGIPCRGNTWKDSTPEVAAFVQKTRPRDMQLL